MTAGKIKTIIVDDEPLARKRVTRLLAAEPDIQIIAECGDGLAAISAIETHRPDLIFLDVEMPEISGFDVLRALDARQLRAVVFVTAFDRYTIQAFDAHAVDYLLKPFSEARFRQALSRARARLGHPEGEDHFAEQVVRLLDRLKPKTAFLERLIVGQNDRLILISVDDVDWVETYGNYLKLHAGAKTYLLRETMNNLAARVDPEKFPRIHRATLVNLDRVSELQPISGGQYAVVLDDGTTLILSRNYRKSFLEKFEV
jgi:two-component system, LytTR family, response regulator